MSFLGHSSDGRWRPFVRIDGLRFTLGFGKIRFLSSRILITWQRPVAHTVCELQVAFELNPRRWRLGRTHMYYDGPHDALDLGPIQLYWDHRWCKRCAE